MTEAITWINDKIQLGDIDMWQYNPRFSTEKQVERIASSYRMFGQVDLIAVGPKNGAGKYPCYNGHQRVHSWLAEYGADYVVDVRRCSRNLTDEERQALTAMLHAGAVGSWDWDTLAGWDNDILQGFGFDEDLLRGWQKDTFALGEMLVSDMLILDDNQSDSHSDRIKPQGNVTIGGFGPFVAKLETSYVDKLVELIKQKYDDDPQVALPLFCQDLINYEDFFS